MLVLLNISCTSWVVLTLKYVGRIIVSHCFLLEAFNVFFFILLDSQLMYEVKGAVASPLLGLTMGTLLSWFNKTTSLTVLVSLFCISSIIYRQICLFSQWKSQGKIHCRFATNLSGIGTGKFGTSWMNLFSQTSLVDDLYVPHGYKMAKSFRSFSFPALSFGKHLRWISGIFPLN